MWLGSKTNTSDHACTHAWSATAALCPLDSGDVRDRWTQSPQTASSGGWAFLSVLSLLRRPPHRRPHSPCPLPCSWAAPPGSSTCPTRWRWPWRRPCPGWWLTWACPRWCCCCFPRSFRASSTCGGWTRLGGGGSGGRSGAGWRSTGGGSWSFLKDRQRGAMIEGSLVDGGK